MHIVSYTASGNASHIPIRAPCELSHCTVDSSAPTSIDTVPTSLNATDDCSGVTGMVLLAMKYHEGPHTSKCKLFATDRVRGQVGA